MTEATATNSGTVKILASEPLAHGGTSDGSFELKFLLADPLADEILELARSCLSPDPHADATFGDGYRVNGLYFDTADLSMYHRLGSFGRRKFRLRRYGSESRVFLERKSKSRGLVRKRRTAVPESELVLLEKDRGRRYETAAALAADAGRYLREQPIEARPPSPVYRFRKFARRHKVTITTVSLVAAVRDDNSAP